MNLTLVDVIFEDAGYILVADDCVAGTRVCRASKPVVCGLYDCVIPRHGYYLYARTGGRLCCRCAITLGALVKVE